MLSPYEATRDMKLSDEATTDPLATMKGPGARRKIGGAHRHPKGRQGISGRHRPSSCRRPGSDTSASNGIRRPDRRRHYYSGTRRRSDRDVIVCDPSSPRAIEWPHRASRVFWEKGQVYGRLPPACPPRAAQNVHEQHPDYRCSRRVDERLNDHGYILPGLGDARRQDFGHEVRHCGARKCESWESPREMRMAVAPEPYKHATAEKKDDATLVQEEGHMTTYSTARRW